MKKVTVLFGVFLISSVPAFAEMGEPQDGGHVSSGFVSAHGTAAIPRPNIILVLTDDLDTQSMEHMKTLKTLLTDQGTTFSQYLVSDSLCCPSRSSILRGQYNHNHLVLSNFPPEGGFQKFHNLGNENSTIATWLQEAGYRTALMGKYLNGYPQGVVPTYVPPGWDEWDSPVRGTPYAEFDYQMNENGTLVSYRREAADYLTDVLTAKAVQFIADSTSDTRPFFMYIAPYAPHIPSTPARRYRDAFPDVKAPRPRSFNEANVEDKPRWVKKLKPLDDMDIERIDDSYRKRLQSMLAVEDMVAGLLDALASAGKLDETYIFFSSDNGYHLGEHRLLPGKQSPYEEDLHVPLIVRGPGVPAGAVRTHLTGNTDLAPTFADLADAGAPASVDGRSLVPLFSAHPPPTAQWRQAFLLEHTDKMTGRGGPGSHEPDSDSALEPEDPLETHVRLASSKLDIPTFQGVRTPDTVYVEYATGEREIYDLSADPLELNNLASRADPTLLERLSAWLGSLRVCAGASCRSTEDGGQSSAMSLP